MVESGFLQRRVNKLSVPLEMMLGEGSIRRARTDWPSGGIARRFQPGSDRGPPAVMCATSAPAPAAARPAASLAEQWEAAPRDALPPCAKPTEGEPGALNQLQPWPGFPGPRTVASVLDATYSARLTVRHKRRAFP